MLLKFWIYFFNMPEPMPDGRLRRPEAEESFCGAENVAFLLKFWIFFNMPEPMDGRLRRPEAEERFCGAENVAFLLKFWIF